MKNLLFLLLFAVAILVGQAWAGNDTRCLANGEPVKCDWNDGSGECWYLTTGEENPEHDNPDGCKLRAGWCTNRWIGGTNGICDGTSFSLADVASADWTLHGSTEVCLWNIDGTCWAPEDDDKRTECLEVGWLFESGVQGATTFCNPGRGALIGGKDDNPPSIPDPGGSSSSSSEESKCMDATNQLFCQYDWGCYALDTQYSSIGEDETFECGPGGPVCTCSQLVGGCPALYINVTNSLPNDGTGEVCTDYGGTLFSGGSSSSSAGSSSSSSSGGSSSSISSSSSSSSAGNSSSSSSGFSSSSNNYNPSSSSDGNVPIISGLTLAANLDALFHAGNLHISSAREATVQLFDIHGKQVFNRKVPNGYNVISLKDQKMGVYFAVVSSGSNKQTIKIVLK